MESEVPKTFPLKLEIEEFALGAVLRRLHEMQGIAKLDLDLGRGGTKPIAKSNGGGEMQSLVIAALMRGQMNVEQLTNTTGLDKKKVYGVVHNLKQKKVIKLAGKGVYVLSDRAKQAAASPPLALPAPTKRGPAGRASPGETGRVVVAILSQHGPSRPVEIAAQLGEHGVSHKSLSGVLARALRDGLVKRTNGVYSLTAKATKESA
jgi:predicted Rossmann fold nucleotide-binding protein DprA/Smf involved in DNA uptake